MEYSPVQLNDLPDEILLIILKKLEKLHVLCSLIGVNKRLNKIAHDSTFTSSLTLFDHLSYDSIYLLSGSMLDRFCSKILPEIHHKIKWLDTEVSSMERILLSADYPNLFGLGIYNIETANDIGLFKDETSLMQRFKNQISSLVIKSVGKQATSRDVNTHLFTHIFNTLINLQYLKFDSLLFYDQRMSFVYSPPVVFSSILLELHVKVDSFDDCLYLLDGRFNQLRTFYVDILCGFSRPGVKKNKEKLPGLRCFLLYCSSEIHIYDRIIIPLLQRMSNLEQLGLYLLVNSKDRFINGNDLKQNATDYMPQLNKFHLNICSTILLKDQIYFPSNEDIQHSFKHFSNFQIISCVNYFSEVDKGQCHIYSKPFTIRNYPNIANNFPGGLFTCVSEVSLFDECPFEHEFFIQIAQSFPFMKQLTVSNRKPQNNKRCGRSKNNNQNLLIIQYPHLKSLRFKGSHDDYVEQFLLDTKTYLPYDIILFADYKSLKRVTHKFTRKGTRINCRKATYVCLNRIRQFPKDFKNYFLNTKTRRL